MYVHLQVFHVFQISTCVFNCIIRIDYFTTLLIGCGWLVWSNSANTASTSKRWFLWSTWLGHYSHKFSLTLLKLSNWQGSLIDINELRIWSESSKRRFSSKAFILRGPVWWGPSCVDHRNQRVRLSIADDALVDLDQTNQERSTRYWWPTLLSEKSFFNSTKNEIELHVNATISAFLFLNSKTFGSSYRSVQLQVYSRHAL